MALDILNNPRTKETGWLFRKKEILNPVEFFPGGRSSRGEVPGATEANRRGKKKKPSSNGNLKSRREACAFNYDNTSSS